MTPILLMLASQAHSQEFRLPPTYLWTEASMVLAAGPNRVPFENTFNILPVDPTGWETGAALIVGPAFVHGRMQWWNKTAAYARPATRELRVGVMANPDDSGFAAGEPLGFLGYSGMFFVGYKYARDMDSSLYSGDVVSDGHAITGGVFKGFGTVDSGFPVYQEVYGVAYVAAWPWADRSRLGFVYRGGFNMGPVLTGFRIDLDPGPGFSVGFEFRLNGALRLTGKAE